MRAPNEWNDRSVIQATKNAMDDFIDLNRENIDTSRIYLFGQCYGGEAVRYLLTDYPYYFAGAVSAAPYGAPSESSVKKFADVPVWILCNSADPLVPWTWIQTYIDTIKKNSKHPEYSRYSKFSKTIDSDGSKIEAHSTDWPVYNDMIMPDGSEWVQQKTYTMSGERVHFGGTDGCISWLSTYRSTYDGSDMPIRCKCKCHSKNGATKFFFKLKIFFSRIFNIKKNKSCACGTQHW